MIKNREIKQILLEKGITHLYHVNYVNTSLTFLNNGGLLSRGEVDDRGLLQSEQKSDDQDQLVGVYYDIFFDSVDIHERGKDVNKYGPVTFVYSIDLIDSLPEGIIKITKDNPIRWKKHTPENERYFSNPLELRLDYVKGTFAQHFTLVNQTEPLPFDYLEEVILDDPGEDKQEYFDEAYAALSSAIEENGLDIALTRRECSEDCKCKIVYKTNKPGYTYYRFKTN